MSRTTGHDVRTADASLRESEDRFRSIFENAAVGMAHLSKDGAWLEMNRRICDMLGYTREELQKRTFQDITHPDDLDLDLGLMQEVLDNKRNTYEMEKRYIRKDGSVVWANLTVGCVRAPDGDVDYFISVLQDVTENHKANNALRQSETRFWSTFENAAVGIVHVALDGSWLRVNEKVCQILGYTSDELLKLDFRQLSHPDDLHLVVGAMREMLAGKRNSFRMEKRYVCKDGSTIWVTLTSATVRDKDGNIEYLIAVIEDISAQRRMHQSLVDSEARFQAVQQAMPDGFLIYRAIRDASGELTDLECEYANPAAERVLRREGLGFQGERLQRDVPAERKVGLYQIFRDVVNTGEPAQGEVEMSPAPHGLWLRYSAAKVDDGLAVSFTNITDRKEAELSLRNSEARFRAVQESMPDGFMLYRAIRDARGGIEDFECYFANPAAHDIASFEKQPFVGRWLIRDTPPQFRVGIGKVFSRVVQTGHSEQGEIRLLEPGEERWIRYSVVKLDDGVAIAFSNITSRIRAERALRESEARFRAVQQTSPDGFMVLRSLRDRNGLIADFGFVYVNPTLERVAGDTAENIMGSTLRMRMPGNVLSGAVDHYIRTVETGEPWRGDIPYPHIGGNRWYRTAIVKVDDGVAVSFSDITDAKRSEMLLQQRDHRLRTILNNVLVFVGLLSPEGVILEVNDTALLLSGLKRSDVVGKYYWEAAWISHSPGVQDKLRAGIARAARGKRVRFDLEVRTAGDGRATIDFQLAPIFDDQKNVIEIVPSAVDISDRVKSEQHREMLVNELSHRVKNSLATVQTIASHTLRDATDLDSFREAFVGRLMAISKCHDLLVDATRRTADLSQLVRDQVLPYARAGAGSQVSVFGPPLVLGPEASHTFGLILHELATNAAKYGALSNENGHLSITWTRRSSPDGAEVMVTWEETGGPPVSLPERHGFGSVLIEQSLTYSLGGKADIEYRPEGLLARFRFRKLG